MIRNIIFDIGNVLADFRWEGFLRDKGFDDAMIHRIGKASVESPLWNEYDRGVIRFEDLLQSFVERDPEIEREIYQAFRDVSGMVVIRDYAIAWVQGFKAKGYHVWYLSNFAEKTQRECGEALAFLPYMDGGILSWEEGIIKPEPEIYQLLLERYHLIPEECIFVDDTRRNIEEAGRHGIHGIVFESKEQVLREMHDLGVDL